MGVFRFKLNIFQTSIIFCVFFLLFALSCYPFLFVFSKVEIYWSGIDQIDDGFIFFYFFFILFIFPLLVRIRWIFYIQKPKTKNKKKEVAMMKKPMMARYSWIEISWKRGATTTNEISMFFLKIWKFVNL